jgi:hypothetical protein
MSSAGGAMSTLVWVGQMPDECQHYTLLVMTNPETQQEPQCLDFFTPLTGR